MFRWFSLSILFFLTSGCSSVAYFTRDTRQPMEALQVRMSQQAPRRCLVIFMPGMFDGPDSYRQNHFFDDATDASRRCDLLAVDAHFGFYRNGSLRRRMSDNIFRVAENRGYEEFWIVGISMGGLGSLMVAQDHAPRVRGVVLLAPFLGDAPPQQNIQTAGGLASWNTPTGIGRDAGEEHPLWSWLEGYRDNPDTMPELYLGVGEQDRERPGVDFLGAHIPAQRRGTTAGGHNWRTWRVLWQRLMRSPPWDPRPGQRPSMRGSSNLD